MVKPVAHLWGLYFGRETNPSYEQPFWNCKAAITREEIKRALDVNDFNRAGSCGSQYQGDRPWHIRQIAGIVDALQKGVEFGPIWLNRDDTIADGCHRLYAYWYLERPTIEVTYELS